MFPVGYTANRSVTVKAKIEFLNYRGSSRTPTASRLKSPFRCRAIGFHNPHMKFRIFVNLGEVS